MNTAIYYSLCALILWVPIPFASNRPWAWAILQAAVALMVLLHLWQAWQGRQRLAPAAGRAWLVLLPLLVLQLWVALQSIPALGLSHDPGQTQIALLKGLSYTAFAWLLVIYVDTEFKLKRLAQVIVLSGLSQAAYGTLELLLDGSLGLNAPGSGRANASFIYHNQLANYLALCLCVALGLLLTEMAQAPSQGSWRDRLRGLLEFMLSSKVIVRLSAIVMIIALIMTQSRMGNAGFFAALGLTGLYALLFYRKKPYHFKTLILSVIVIDLVVVGAIFGVDKVKDRIENTAFASETRDNVLVDALPMLQDHWLTGTGLGSFYSSFPQYQTGLYGGFYDHAHNDYLQFAIELGLPMTLLLLAMLAAVLLLALVDMRSKGSKLRRGMAFATAMAIVHMAFHSSVDFSLQAPANALLFVALLVMVAIQCQPVHIQRMQPST